jgi:hypothetical protein
MGDQRTAQWLAGLAVQWDDRLAEIKRLAEGLGAS